MCLWKHLSSVRRADGLLRIATDRFLFVSRKLSGPASASRRIDTNGFLSEFPYIVSATIQRNKFLREPEMEMWIRKLLEYNSSGGFKTRGLMTLCAYQMMETPENITEESLRLARILGWCVEMTGYLLVDDMIDHSTTRRGSTCWYRLPQVGIRAVNDAVFVKSVVFDTLEENFGDKPYYSEILNAFHKAIYEMTLGFHMDYVSLKNVNVFTMKNYLNIASLKTTYYTFNLPLKISSVLAGKVNKDTFKTSGDIVIDMGILTIIQNDYMDIYGDVSVTGKEGTDIQEGKCTWLAVTALQRCNQEQRKEFEAHYGSPDLASVQRIKRLYEELQLPKFCSNHIQTFYDGIVHRINSIPADDVLPPSVLKKLLDMMYHLHSGKEQKSKVLNGNS